MHLLWADSAEFHGSVHFLDIPGDVALHPLADRAGGEAQRLGQIILRQP